MTHTNAMSFWTLSCRIPETVSQGRHADASYPCPHFPLLYLDGVLQIFHFNWTWRPDLNIEYWSTSGTILHTTQVPDSYSSGHYARVHKYPGLTFHYLCATGNSCGPFPLFCCRSVSSAAGGMKVWVTWETGEEGDAKTDVNTDVTTPLGNWHHIKITPSLSFSLSPISKIGS